MTNHETFYPYLTFSDEHFFLHLSFISDRGRGRYPSAFRDGPFFWGKGGGGGGEDEKN